MRRLVLLSLAAAALAFAQQKPDPKELNLMLDQIRAAIRAEDWSEASRLAIRLRAALLNARSRTPVSPLIELQHLEILAGQNATTRNPLLPRMARAAYAAGEWSRAEGLANEALAAARNGVFWWTGDAIHQGNTILGRLALRENKLDVARNYLLAAGKTPGSSTLGTQGPAMQLAKDLLDRGETAAVLQYLDLCGQFWSTNRGKLQEWTVLIRAGLKPDFGPNLDY